MRAPRTAAALERLLSVLSASDLRFAAGDGFDEFVQANLSSKTKLILPEQWKKSSIYEEARLAVRPSHCDGVLTLKEPLDGLFRIDKPNGQQNWPDTLLIEGTFGLGIEYKSSKTGQPVWNSGLPKIRGLYLYHETGNSSPELRTTFFLGCDAISPPEEQLLVQGRTRNAEIADQINTALASMGSLWSLYPRPMHNWKGRPARDPERADREQRVYAFLASLR